MATAEQAIKTEPGPAQARLHVAALAASLASFALAIAAVPDLTERLGSQGWLLLGVLPWLALLEYGAARVQHRPNAARAVAKAFVQLAVTLLVVVSAGLVLHPYVATSDYSLTVAFGVVGFVMFGAAEVVTKDGTKARTDAAIGFALLAMGVVAMLAIGVGGSIEPVALVALVAVLGVGYARNLRAAR
jgi:hypothetical protein